MFAISFASVSVVIGVFGTYDDVLQKLRAGRNLVIPDRGGGPGPGGVGVSAIRGTYQWAHGWPTRISMPDAAVNMAPSEHTARGITVLLLVIQPVIVIASTRIVGWTNSLAVGVDIVVVLGIALTVAVMLTGDGSTETLFSQGIAADAPGYFALGGGLMAALIMGISTLVGFDAAANMAESRNLCPVAATCTIMRVNRRSRSSRTARSVVASRTAERPRGGQSDGAQRRQKDLAPRRPDGRIRGSSRSPFPS